MRRLTKILIFYCQAQGIIYTRGQNQNMDWKNTWKYIQIGSLITRCMAKSMTEPWLKVRLGNIGKSDLSSVIKRLNPKGDVVYYIASALTRHAYVGQTGDEKGWQQRLHTEIRTAKTVFYDRKKRNNRDQLRKWTD